MAGVVDGGICVTSFVYVGSRNNAQKREFLLYVSTLAHLNRHQSSSKTRAIKGCAPQIKVGDASMSMVELAAFV
jgi:hypothetical protein